MPAQTPDAEGRQDEKGSLSQTPAGSGNCQAITLSVHIT